MLRGIMRSLVPGCWFLMGSSVKPSPALDLYITVKTDREKCKPPPQLAMAKSGAKVCKVGR